MNVTQAMIEIVRETAERAGSRELERARLCLLDWLGCAIAGAREPLVDILVADAEPGGGHALIGRPERVGLRDAVLINGAAGHALDYDDGMQAMIGHPSVAIMPALVSVATAEGLSGDRLLRAIVAGAEAGGRAGSMLTNDHYLRGFHGTATMGAIGATAGHAFLVGLDMERTAMAIGLAGTRAAGLKASFGTDGKPLHAGWAALIALTSVRWAARGMTGCDDILAHPQGIGLAASGTFDAEAGLTRGEQPHILTVAYKAHAACAITHPAIDAMIELRGTGGFDPGRIRRIRLDVSAQADTICNNPDPRTGLALKFSLRGATAMAARGIDTANPSSYSEATANDPSVRALIDRTDVVLHPDFALGETRLTVELADGAERTAGGSMRFEDDHAILRRRLGAKFQGLVAPRLGVSAARALEDGVMANAHGPDARDLLRLCAVEPVETSQAEAVG